MTVNVAESTLRLPRILCLHGGGTNASIFRMQCRVLERMLFPHFRLVFAEAPFPAQPDPVVTSVYKDYGPFKAWLRVRPQDAAKDPQHVADEIEASLAAARLADDRRGASGEWIGLLGFSQGAKLAASILASQEELRRRFGDCVVRPSYRFAVLLAGRGPLVWLHPALPMPPGLVDAAQPTTGIWDGPEAVADPMGDRLQILTIHVHGLADPGLDLHRMMLQQYCDPHAVTLVEWDGDHRVPIKSKDVQRMVEQILVIGREVCSVLRFKDI